METWITQIQTNRDPACALGLLRKLIKHLKAHEPAAADRIWREAVEASPCIDASRTQVLNFISETLSLLQTAVLLRRMHLIKPHWTLTWDMLREVKQRGLMRLLLVWRQCTALQKARLCAAPHQFLYLSRKRRKSPLYWKRLINFVAEEMQAPEFAAQCLCITTAQKWVPVFHAVQIVKRQRLWPHMFRDAFWSNDVMIGTKNKTAPGENDAADTPSGTSHKSKERPQPRSLGLRLPLLQTLADFLEWKVQMPFLNSFQAARLKEVLTKHDLWKPRFETLLPVAHEDD